MREFGDVRVYLTVSIYNYGAGMGEVCDLFQGSPNRLRRKYIRLLEKFEVALQLTETQVIIPSLMPSDANYPKPNDCLSDIEMDVDSFYQPPMRRFWLAAYIPEGFWPRLICRIATDHQIGKVCVYFIYSLAHY